ncbi:MAG: ATP-binding protein [Elusimicrobiota bacterium]|jgi:AAA15 family ATPase/GTPase|nr:ATP-binding protein [Elusimicrobiota bacterium]
MLLEFKVKNFKSFREEAIFSMLPTMIKDLEYSILNQTANKQSYKALSSSVIYGPNAAGKTNIVEAMNDFKRIILLRNILNGYVSNLSPTRDNGYLEFIPNVKSSDIEPTLFAIKFIFEEKIFEYSISLQLGRFGVNSPSRKILEEKFLVNEKLIFTREEKNINVYFDNLKQILKSGEDLKNDVALNKTLENNLIPTDLFLNNAFKIVYSKSLVESFEKWISKYLNVICMSDKLEAIPPLQLLPELEKEGRMLRNKLLDKVLNKLEIVSKISYGKNRQNNRYELMSTVNNNVKAVTIPSKNFESWGTLRLSNLIGLIDGAINNGHTLVMDEFDASIHPMIIMSIINLFHNDEINKKSAQLIFNTHNPIFLDSSLFRRDEIKFVDKEEGSDTSILYSLSDFGTNGDNPVRKTTDYMKNYFVNRYGAIKEIDLSGIFSESIANGK